MSISKHCMIVNLHIGAWKGYRLDKAASQRVVYDANAERDAARVNKHLIPKLSLKNVETALNAVRAHFYDCTLPWKDNGDRVLTRKVYMRFMQEHSERVDRFHEAVDEFVNVLYPQARDQAAFRMGDLFNADDYPTADLLRHKFYVHLDIDGVSESNDFRVELDNQEEVRRNLETANQQRVASAMRYLWTELHEKLGHFADKMSSDSVFRDSTVRNLEKIVSELPDKTLFDDPNLEQIRADIEATVTGYTAKELRDNEHTRSAVSAEAQRILDQMKGFMNAFGGTQ